MTFYARHDCAMCRTARVGEDGVYVADGFEFCRGCALRIAAVIDLATGRMAVGLST